MNNISRIPSRIVSYVVSKAPQMTVSGERANKAIAWVGKNISSPENRFILGATALMSQPFIDLHNRKIDEDTRKVSAARTVAKIIAGTLTGVLIRSACIHSVNAFTKLPHEIKPNMNFKALRNFFTPSEGVCKNLDKYKDAMGTILATVVMMFTNFLIDAPLTKFLTNKFVDKIHNNAQTKSNSSQNLEQVKIANETKEVGYA